MLILAERIGGILLGAAPPVHILLPSATARRIVSMTALAVIRDTVEVGDPSIAAGHLARRTGFDFEDFWNE